MKSILELSAAIMLAAQPSGDIESQARIAGYLKGLVPGTGRVDVVRAGDPVQTKSGMPLLDGDKIIITGNAKINIMSNVAELSGNRTSADSPILFPVWTPPPSGFVGVIKRLYAALNVPITIIERPPASAAQTPTKGVGDCPPSIKFSGTLEAVPALRSSIQYLDEPAPWTLAWIGGKSPYEVEYKTNGAWQTLSHGPLCMTHASVDLPLSAGTAQLRVRDADGKEILWAVEMHPRALVRSGRSDYDQILDAMTDLNDPSGRYGMSALTRLDRVSDRDFLAWRLLSAVFENNITQ